MFDVADEIKEYIGKPKKPKSFKKFCKKVTIQASGKLYTLSEYKKHLKKTKSYRGKGVDPRLTKDYWEDVYRFYYKNWDTFIQAFLDNNLTVKSGLEKFTPCKTRLYNERDLSVVKGGAVPKGRLNKSIFWEHIYNTSSSVADRKLLDDLKSLVNFQISSYFLYPSMGKYFKTDNFSSYFMSIRATYPTLSVFNPYAYANILDNVLCAKKVFTPVLSWGSPAIALANSSHIERLVACDVIPEVVARSRKVFKELNTDKNKKFKAFCCPSEKLKKRYKFDRKFKNYFDTVFFSPPYFDLEQYEGGEQSLTSYPTYEKWLEKYWRKTVELCYTTLKPGGTFSFIIVPFYKSRTTKTKLEISQDMLDIASEYFEPVDTKKLAWGNFRGNSDSEKRQSTNFLEDSHILKKRW